MARKDPYAWGEERPSARKKRLRRLADQTDLEIKSARATYEKTVAGIRARKASLLQECERIERCLNARGEYDPILAKAAAPGGWNSNELTVKRPRGRPRTRFPGDPPPPRKSRAKAGGRSGHRSSARAQAKIPAPVLTAEQMPTMPSKEALPRAAAVFLPKTAGLAANDNLQPDAASVIAPIRPEMNDDAYEQELAEERVQEAARLERIKYERYADEVALAEQRREPFKMPYDFSDAVDRAKAPQVVLDRYPQFGLVVTQDPAAENMDEIPDEDLNIWLTILANSDEMWQDPEWELRIFQRQRERGVRYAGITHSAKIQKLMNAERMRRKVWLWLERRMHKAELLGASLAQGGNLEQVLDELAHFDYMTERNFGKAERAEYVKIVDVLRWPLHFSRKELIVRADPSQNPDQTNLWNYSSLAGTPKIFPRWRELKQPRPPEVSSALAKLFATIPPPWDGRDNLPSARNKEGATS